MFKKLASPRAIFVSLYAVFLTAYIIIGLQPASAASLYIIGTLNIPSINLDTEVAKLTLENNQLTIPDEVVGEYHISRKNHLLLGHSTTIFRDIERLQQGDVIYYNNETYQVISSEVRDKDQIKMKELLQNDGTDKLTLMTCAGELLANQDATERLIITATKVNQNIGANKWI